jgi:hypothetical protein
VAYLKQLIHVAYPKWNGGTVVKVEPFERWPVGADGDAELDEAFEPLLFHVSHIFHAERCVRAEEQLGFLWPHGERLHLCPTAREVELDLEDRSLLLRTARKVERNLQEAQRTKPDKPMMDL